MAKSLRYLEVYQSIKALKEASLDEILVRVAQSLGGETPNQSLRRAVRRDLNALVENHLVDIQYFTPSGDPIDPDDEENFKNKRARYGLVESKKPIHRGQAVLFRNGIQVVSRESVRGCINFTDRYIDVPCGSFVVAFDGLGGSFIYLWVVFDDLPLNVEFARKTHSNITLSEQISIQDNLIGRSLLVLVQNLSVSRYKMRTFQASVRLEVDSDGKSCTWIVNEPGPSFKHSVVDHWDRVLQLFPCGEETLEFPTIDFQWKPIGRKKVTNLLGLVSVGEMLVIPHFKK